MHVYDLDCFWSASYKINKPVSLFWGFFGHYAMLAQGNQQYQCLKWAPDNSSLPSQLQFRQDFGMFPVMTVPAYFLFVLIRSCMLNEIMLFKDSKMHTRFYLVLFWIIHRVSLWFVSKRNCASFARLQLCRPGCPMEHPKNWCVSPLQERRCGKMATWRPDGLGSFVAWQMSEGSSSLFVWWEVGATLPEEAVHGHWHVLLQVFHQRTPFLQSGVQWCFADFRHTLARHKFTLAGFFLMHQPDGWCSETKKKDGFSYSMRDFRKIRCLVWGFARALKIMAFVLEEIGLLASKAST